MFPYADGYQFNLKGDWSVITNSASNIVIALGKGNDTIEITGGVEAVNKIIKSSRLRACLRRLRQLG